MQTAETKCMSAFPFTTLLTACFSMIKLEPVCFHNNLPFMFRLFLQVVVARLCEKAPCWLKLQETKRASWSAASRIWAWTNRILATETSYSCLDALLQACTDATQWLETTAERKTPLCCWSSGFKGNQTGARTQRSAPTRFDWLALCDWCLFKNKQKKYLTPDWYSESLLSIQQTLILKLSQQK